MVQACQAVKAKLAHVHEWAEMPNGAQMTVEAYNEFIQESAKEVESLEERSASLAAQNKVMQARSSN